MELTPLCITIPPIYWTLLMLSCGLDLGDAFLIISPDRSQFFYDESVTLSCVFGWRMKRYTLNEGTLECGNNWGKPKGSICTISSIRPKDNGHYWCESGSGEQGYVVNITVHDGPVILESPTLPVTEGHSVTLRCRYKRIPFDLTADFYKDGSLINNEPTGEMTIPDVTKSDEGLYCCKHSELGKSPDRWITVTGNSPSSPLIIPLSVAGVSISLIILLVLFCYCKRNKHVASASTDLTYAEVKFTQGSGERREKPPAGDPIYSTLKKPNNTVPSHPETARVHLP
ncbi:hypothetical protein UPYG_G00246540 [Umbra pygmaea]|uniref:Ig-like domain-containing protein n=1 Tax=Umbra pygmaea TaxID=75934 RepID=A0ABD0WH74_UMBPY